MARARATSLDRVLANTFYKISTFKKGVNNNFLSNTSLGFHRLGLLGFLCVCCLRIGEATLYVTVTAPGHCMLTNIRSICAGNSPKSTIRVCSLCVKRFKKLYIYINFEYRLAMFLAHIHTNNPGLIYPFLNIPFHIPPCSMYISLYHNLYFHPPAPPKQTAINAWITVEIPSPIISAPQLQHATARH